MDGRHKAGGRHREAGGRGARWTLIKVIVSLACGGLSFWVYAKVAWAYLLAMTHGALESNPVLGIASFVAVVVCATLLCYRDLDVFDVGISKGCGDAQAVAYCTLLMLLLMTKSMGVRGMNWDIAAIVDELVPLSPTLVLNVLLFVPVGMLMSDVLKKSPWAHVAAIAVLLLIEVLQYALSLGICDINDVLVNYCGMVCGMAVATWLRAHVCTLRCDGGRYVVRRVVRA